MNGIPDKLFLSVSDVATVLDCHRTTVTNMIADGRLRAFRIGPKCWRIPRYAVCELIGISKDNES